MTPTQRSAAVKTAQQRMVWAGVAGAPGFVALAFYLMGRFSEPLHPALGTPKAMTTLGVIAVVFIALELYLVFTSVKRKAQIAAAQQRWGD